MFAQLIVILAFVASVAATRPNEIISFEEAGREEDGHARPAQRARDHQAAGIS